MTEGIDHPHQWYGGRTFAQHGDDLAILNIFKRLGIERPSYVDIGAHHPFDLSNTALLYQRGSRGINVEANPALIEAFQFARPEDKNVCVAIGPKHGSASFNRINETSGANSLLPIESSQIAPITVPVITADEVIDIYSAGKWTDLLSIDAEGMDVEILSSIDYRVRRPSVICAEAVSMQRDLTEPLKQLMQRKGYFVHSWAGSNILFVHEFLKDRLY
jgi:FkbM family methyltransferase